MKHRLLVFCVFLAFASVATAAGPAKDPCAVCRKQQCAATMRALTGPFGLPRPLTKAEQRQQTEQWRRATLKQLKLKAVPSCDALNDLPWSDANALWPFIPNCHEQITCHGVRGPAGEFAVEKPSDTRGWNKMLGRCAAEDCVVREVIGMDKVWYRVAWYPDPAKQFCVSRWTTKPTVRERFKLKLDNGEMAWDNPCHRPWMRHLKAFGDGHPTGFAEVPDSRPDTFWCRPPQEDGPWGPAEAAKWEAEHAK